MSQTLTLALASLAVGAVMGLLVLAAAAAAGRPKKLLPWLIGSAWGVLYAGLLLTDCLARRGPGPLSEAAFPIYYTGLFAWPAALAWGRPKWGLRWLYAQMIMLLTAIPAFVTAVAAALCNLT